MLAVNNNKVILKGHRNRVDSLWDIPTHKNNTNTNCYSPTRAHASMYSARQTEVTETEITRPIKSHRQPLPAQLTNLSELALCNDFDNAIIEHYKANAIIEHCKVNASHTTSVPTTLYANVILRKKQTHSELVTYLYACCFPR